MSIRLRLTLLYSSILAITLLVFGLVLYSFQARNTLDALKEDIARGSERMVSAVLRMEFVSPPVNQDMMPPPAPRPFSEFSTDRDIQTVQEREIARILDASGNLIASPFGNIEDALPLSDQGINALQIQQEWWESSTVNGEHMLIYSQPVVYEGQTRYIVQVARSLVERDRTMKSLIITLGAAGLATILIAFAAGWVLSGYSLKPIDRMTRTAKAIGEKSDFNRRVDYSGPPDEVGLLASTFNDMLNRLQDAYQKLEQSLTAQRNFMADVSHELRTPLTTLRGNLDLLRRRKRMPQIEQTDILNDMIEETNRLIRLVNDLLMLARANARQNLVHKPVAIKPILEESIRQVKLLDANRSITLSTDARGKVIADRDAIKQVMLILLDNAIKHTQTSIEIEARHSEGQVEISVCDHGPGLPSDRLEQVFDRFNHEGGDASTEGYGLGLPIAKALVEDMGGRITIQSVIGQGSIITIVLPIIN